MSILNRLTALFAPPAADKHVATLYAACVNAARQPAFYARLSVPDTVDGRFDMILLHIILVLRNLKDRHIKQQLFDLMFKNMDQALREMGVGDMSIGKKIKPMLQAFYGRAATYEKALQQTDDTQLAETLKRNILGSTETEGLANLTAYVRTSAAQLATQNEEDIRAGNPHFASLQDTP